MIVGIPRERKDNETRVALDPAGVRALVERGHKVVIEKSAGARSGISDEDYLQAGAQIRAQAADIFNEAELIMKVKEPVPQEYDLLHEGQILFTFLHLAASLELTKALLRQGVIGIAYETVQLEDGSLPLLTPMSEIAGKMSIQIGCRYLETENGGSGVLLGGIPGIKPGNVTIIGGGIAGINAAKVALGMGANVIILDVNLDKLRYLDDVLGDRATTLASNSANIESAVADADLVVGAVLLPGARAPRLVTRDMIRKMRSGSVVVDIAIDQGGCIETSAPTTYSNPIYKVEGITHCCITNIPSAVGRTATLALANATLPYALKLADLGYEKALLSDKALKKGLNVFQGKLVNRAVAESLSLQYVPFDMS